MREIYFIFCVLDLCICVVFVLCTCITFFLCLDMYLCGHLLVFSMVDMYLCIVSGHVLIFMLCFYKNVLSFYDMSTFWHGHEYCGLSLAIYHL